jgi:hypothetical protein
MTDNKLHSQYSLQGPVSIPCLVEWGWNDRLQSIKVQNSIGMENACLSVCLSVLLCLYLDYYIYNTCICDIQQYDV